ncbi:MAG: undecaprenyl-diphosphate phosphatase [Flavobacteriales bacterium]
MDKLLEAIILGIVQGLTEFLPVSSSGHLEIAKAMLGNSDLARQSMLMTVVLHFATALSTVVIFRKEIVDIFKGLFQFKSNEQTEYSLKIVFSMIPAAVVGVFFDDIIEGFFNGKLLLVGAMLLVTGFILFVANRARNTKKHVGFTEAIIIGVAQAIAILPGISRSGATISTAVILGVDREKAARFSFLMVVPLILGKMAKDLLSDEFSLSGINSASLIVGFFAAFITGLFACKIMITVVKRSKLAYFSIYCFFVGTIAIIYSLI